MILAALAGMTGSFVHSAQSLSTFLGNRKFKRSWFTWYCLRPWIGGVLGSSIYVVFRAGLVSGASAMNPYGVVALAALAGWFAKIASDKLEQVFTTMFKTPQDQHRRDKVNQDEGQDN